MTLCNIIKINNSSRVPDVVSRQPVRLSADFVPLPPACPSLPSKKPRLDFPCAIHFGPSGPLETLPGDRKNQNSAIYTPEISFLLLLPSLWLVRRGRSNFFVSMLARCPPYDFPVLPLQPVRLIIGPQGLRNLFSKCPILLGRPCRHRGLVFIGRGLKISAPCMMQS